MTPEKRSKEIYFSEFINLTNDNANEKNGKKLERNNCSYKGIKIST